MHPDNAMEQDVFLASAENTAERRLNEEECSEKTLETQGTQTSLIKINLNLQTRVNERDQLKT